MFKRLFSMQLKAELNRESKRNTGVAIGQLDVSTLQDEDTAIPGVEDFANFFGLNGIGR